MTSPFLWKDAPSFAALPASYSFQEPKYKQWLAAKHANPDTTPDWPQYRDQEALKKTKYRTKKEKILASLGEPGRKRDRKERRETRHYKNAISFDPTPQKSADKTQSIKRGGNLMDQLSIDFSSLSTCRARRSDPATSHQAAKNAAKFADSHAGRILAALKLHGHRTAHELEGIVGLTVVQCDRRLPELENKGLVRVVKLHDGADWVRDGFRVWEAI